ncbi:MAG TPA: SbcC/MukB-like Walker B domain-containing protein, partial [Acidimicrobiia bacterium]|nr:SbcC/MukB-like Walker B domain-containing protein [Acidimicrobiia bacterium]
AVATCAGLQSQRDGYLAALAEHPDAGRVAAALSEIDACRVAAAKARAAERDARTAEGEAQALVRSARDQTEQIEDAFGRQRERLLRAGLDPPEPSGGLAGAWSAFVAWATREHASRVSEQAAARAEHEQLLAARAARVDALVVQARTCGVAPESVTLPGLRDEIIEQGTRARNELQQIDDAQERAAKLREQSAAARTEHEVARLLGDLLRSDRFEKWLLAEALDVLVDAASRTLYALSQGRFSLRSSTEEEFVIVDHRNADETRSVRTLSGGETFQASLALALALSDQLASLSAAGGVKLDAIFLDEGFGSLDADTLDAVASTIETLGTEGRMVGIVTHVPALAERVPVRFRVHDGTVTREES